MVPATCNICKRRLMIWDVTRFYCRMAEGIGEIDICDVCIPAGAVKEDKTTELDFRDVEKKQDLRHMPSIAEDDWSPGFTGPEDGSEDRFDKRKTEVPWFKHTFWWFVHNCVAHPLIGVLPFTPLFKFHDWTSVKMHGRT